RANPSAHLVVTGCYAEVATSGVKAIEGVDRIMSNEDKERLVELTVGMEDKRSEPDYSQIPISSPSLPIPSNRTRAFVKIQDGCDNRCTYCLVRLARGRQRSRPQEDILAEIEARVEAGYKEVVLTGVHVGAYGRDGGNETGESLWSLVEAILSRTAVPRLRLSSIEPWDLDPAFLPLWEDARLCRHLHLPLQSGCDATLRRMARRYTTAEFAALVIAARRTIPDLALTTDIIVGFPGETDEEFEESLRFVEKMGFARIHVFRYSARPGTPAAAMPHQLPPDVMRDRSQAMLDLARRSAEGFRRGFLGRRMEVLWEERRKAVWSGLTDNYIRVETRSEADLTNLLIPTELVALTDNGMLGQPLE
ncbi:MAG: MiaB/RimO family radical SAM methylthiotransferase, partial [Anaerolineae bacterium]